MREQGVEVRLGTEVKNLFIVSMVQVGEHAEQLAIDVFDCRGEVGGEFSS